MGCGNSQLAQRATPIRTLEVAPASAQSAPKPAIKADVKLREEFECVKPLGQQVLTLPWLSPCKMVRTHGTGTRHHEKFRLGRLRLSACMVNLPKVKISTRSFQDAPILSTTLALEPWSSRQGIRYIFRSLARCGITSMSHGCTKCICWPQLLANQPRNPDRFALLRKLPRVRTMVGAVRCLLCIASYVCL